jgi:hypothetical protein
MWKQPMQLKGHITFTRVFSRRVQCITQHYTQNAFWLNGSVFEEKLFLREHWLQKTMETAKSV